MTTRLSPRRVLPLFVALLLGFAPALGLPPLVPPQAAEAFNPPIHIAIFEQALGNNFSAEARGWVAEGLTRSDSLVGQGHAEWHFDSANDPSAICSLWNRQPPNGQGPNWLLDEAARRAVEAFRIVRTDAPGFDRVGTNRREALALYGQYLHAIQDFYTHTNWIELHLDPTTPHSLRTLPPVAPIQKECDAKVQAALPPTLQSGFFGFNSANLVATVRTSAPDFCGPVAAPRPPATSQARICHGPPHPDTMNEILRWIPQALVSVVNWQAGRDVTVSTLAPALMLSKDLPDLYHGREPVRRPDGKPTTYHQEAVRLATEATPETFDVFKQRVVTALGASPDLKPRDPECLFQVLVMGGDPECPLLEGRRYETDTPLPPAPVGSRGEGTLGILNYGLERQRYTTTSLHVEIILDPATNQATGSLAVEIFSQEYKDQSVNNPVWSPEYLFTFTGTTETPGTFDGTDGGITFTGTEVQMVGWAGDQVRRENTRSLGVRLALDDQGRLVLCSTGSFSTEPAARRQECLDYAYAVLEPVDGGVSPPTPPIT